MNTSVPSPDTVYRSPTALVGGSLTLFIVGGLAVDALLNGSGRAVLTAVGVLLLVVPLVVAFSFRPAVYANDERLRVRNPFRVITLPWGQVAGLRSGLSHEVVAEDGRRYELWALPVSLRDRRKSLRATAASERDADARGPMPKWTGAAAPGGNAGGAVVSTRRGTDRIVEELRERRDRQAEVSTAQGEVTVRRAYEVFVPAVAGAVLLLVLQLLG
ncbi:PH domain-containing protein [Streptomyces sp. NPDC005012]|uniref:PH domain-containing protein n=1 Tax=Streptomyces sp. NPDC005012 TaxID=3154558 RepID=UPI0033AACD42